MAFELCREKRVLQHGPLLQNDAFLILHGVDSCRYAKVKVFEDGADAPGTCLPRLSERTMTRMLQWRSSGREMAEGPLHGKSGMIE